MPYHVIFASLSIPLITIRGHRWHPFQIVIPTIHILPDLSAFDSVSGVHLPFPPTILLSHGSQEISNSLLGQFQQFCFFPPSLNVTISPELELSLLHSFSLSQPIHCLLYHTVQCRRGPCQLLLPRLMVQFRVSILPAC